MTYTHLTTNELVMIEVYVEEGISVLKIAQSLKRSRQTIHKAVTFLKQGNSASDYYQNYKANQSLCGRRQAILSENEKTFIQGYLRQDWSLDVIKGIFPDRISYSMRTLYRLVDRGELKAEDMPWKGKRRPDGYSEKRGKQAFRRTLRERAAKYPDFETEFGHLEGDTIIGKEHKSAVIAMVERCSKAIITL